VLFNLQCFVLYVAACTPLCSPVHMSCNYMHTCILLHSLRIYYIDVCASVCASVCVCVRVCE
jgi:hypothetical protein